MSNCTHLQWNAIYHYIFTSTTSKKSEWKKNCACKHWERKKVALIWSGPELCRWWEEEAGCGKDRQHGIMKPCGVVCLTWFLQVGAGRFEMPNQLEKKALCRVRKHIWHQISWKGKLRVYCSSQCNLIKAKLHCQFFCSKVIKHLSNNMFKPEIPLCYFVPLQQR